MKLCDINKERIISNYKACNKRVLQSDKVVPNYYGEEALE